MISMELLSEREIRDFRIRGNCLNRRSLLSRGSVRSLRKETRLPNRPGYSPPAVEFELHGGPPGSLSVREIDIPLLCQDDFESANRYLAMILNARRGDPEAAMR